MPLLAEQMLRILAATIVGAAIGYEREIKNKPAGFFTFTLVCVGSCLIAILQENLLIEYPGTEPGRVIAQVVSGIGFLGAGSIIHNKGNVKGITTAAMLWLVSALGLLIGTGGINNYVVAGVTVIIVLPITMFSRRLSDKLAQTKKVQRIRIVFEETHEKDLFDNFATQGVIVRKSFLLNKFMHEDKHLKESIIYFSLPKTRKFQDVITQVSQQEYVFEIQES